MPGVVNRLTGSSSLLTNVNTVGGWSTTNLEVTAIGFSELAPVSQFRQLELNVVTGFSSGKLTLTDLQLNISDADNPIIFVFAVKMPTGGTVTAKLIHEDNPLSNFVETTTNLLESAAAVNAEGVQSPQWFIFRSDAITIIEPQDIPSLTIEITFTPLDTLESFYFTTPAVYQKYEFFTNNEAVVAIASQIPDVIVSGDADADVSPDVPLMRFIDVATLGLGESLEDVRKMAYLDVSEGFDDADDATKSILANHDVADYDTLLWLCKFSGTSPLTRYESSLDYLSEPFVLGETEGDGGSTLNSADVLRLTSYSDLNPPPLTLSAQEALLRWQIEYGYYGKNAGTLPAVLESAKIMLVGTESASISYNYDAEPFVIDLKTFWYETYGATGPEVVGESSELVLEAIEYARPLGTLIRHEMVA